MSRLGVVCALCLFFGTSGCGAAPSVDSLYDPSMPPTAAPLLTVTTAAGAWQVSVWTLPQPARKGSNDVIYRITDLRGGPIDGLAVSVLPWMPAHGHGTSAATTTTAEGDGRYLITPAYLYMSGRWELRTQLRAGPNAPNPTADGTSNDSATPVLDIP